MQTIFPISSLLYPGLFFVSAAAAAAAASAAAAAAFIRQLVIRQLEPLRRSNVNIRLVNPFRPEFTIVIFIHYKPRIAVAILDL